MTCPLCQQAITKAASRRCANCGKAILLHHRWHFLGCLVAHLNCEQPEGKPTETAGKQALLETQAKPQAEPAESTSTMEKE